MPDKIRLLPEHIASQIAAGEVVQRPASVVKELIENSIDAGATHIKLILKDAGTTLIQVIDNGSGMSHTDARMCFEHHATSKITRAEDLFQLSTFGFRGEAMASIAAVAQVEMKSRRAEDEAGTHISIEGSKVMAHEPCAAPVGTNISVKNLFFNLPARRKFLKSIKVEFQHVQEEFLRAAMTYTNVGFTLSHEAGEMYQLSPGNIAARISQLFGNGSISKIVPLEEATPLVQLRGYIGKPEHARKSRGEQYFFVNNRFIKDRYLHHAIASAYSQLIAADNHPSYFIYITLNPEHIDVNVHPTKTEIKFQDERIIYQTLHATVKRTLGLHNMMPSIDFNTDSTYEAAIIENFKNPSRPSEPIIRLNPLYNPFEADIRQTNNLKNWDALFVPNTPAEAPVPELDIAVSSSIKAFQIQNTFIATPVKSGLMLIHQRKAHEKILFTEYQKYTSQAQGSQQILFPQSLELSMADVLAIEMMTTELGKFGFDIQAISKNTYCIYGIPTSMAEGGEIALVRSLIDDFNQSQATDNAWLTEYIAKKMARANAIRTGQSLNDSEIQELIHKLFACPNPNLAIDSGQIIHTINIEEMGRWF